MLANGWNEVQIFGRGEVDVDSILLSFTDTQEGQPVPREWSAKCWWMNHCRYGSPPRIY